MIKEYDMFRATISKKKRQYSGSLVKLVTEVDARFWELIESDILPTPRQVEVCRLALVYVTKQIETCQDDLPKHLIKPVYDYSEALKPYLERINKQEACA